MGAPVLRLTLTQLVGPAAAAVAPQWLTGHLWRQARAGDRLEHVRVRVTPGRIGVALFLLAADEAGARRTARFLCTRALGEAYELRDWRLAE
ncbi:hypothetical protein [Streptomyces sp. CBMA156]|uniref:hypothetical protein n=1 Tax=Streptomyces sp. CBMA156 TaxID=1930280 RepID=UPI001661E951|nr:hypothetical protein [Streptomyces sp. CBMA156]MBD0669720.1 hypothetical protein [Streptomyces sp. CBMA156]MBD0672948.1 hypothetical protein [Streptomyces sp. CBMA156]